jgi:hypothetical protein
VPGEIDLRKFVVEAEQHYWVHPPSPRLLRNLSRAGGAATVAIDRFTGQVIDKQIEVVNE